MWIINYITYNLSNARRWLSINEGDIIEEKIKFTNGNDSLKIKLNIRIDEEYYLTVPEENFILKLNGNFSINDYAIILELLFKQAQIMKTTKFKKQITDKQILFQNHYKEKYDIWNHEDFLILLHTNIEDTLSMILNKSVDFSGIDTFLMKEHPEYNITKYKINENINKSLPKVIYKIKKLRGNSIYNEDISPYFEILLNDDGKCTLGDVVSDKRKIDSSFQIIDLYSLFENKKYFFEPKLGFNLYMKPKVYSLLKGTLEKYINILDEWTLFSTYTRPRKTSKKEPKSDSESETDESFHPRYTSSKKLCKKVKKKPESDPDSERE